MKRFLPFLLFALVLIPLPGSLHASAHNEVRTSHASRRHGWNRWCYRHSRCLAHHPWIARTNPVIRHERWRAWCSAHPGCLKLYPLPMPAGTVSLAGLSYCGLAAGEAYNHGIRDRFNLTQFVAFADGESNCTLVANYQGSGASGAWQIEPSDGYSQALLLSSWDYNGWAVANLSSDGTNWQPWSGEINWGCVAGGWCPATVYASVNEVLRRAR